MRIASIGSSLFDPSQFINRLAAGAGQKGQSNSSAAQPSASEMASNLARSVIDTADKNKDGALSVEEAGQSEEVFNRFDTDGDGLISEDELIAGMTDDLTSLQAMFETGSTTSTTSTNAGVNSLFDLSAVGLQVPPPPPPPPPPTEGGAMDTNQIATDLAASILEAADSDGDGYLTLEESGQSEEVFNRFDTDGDGLLNKEELIAGLQTDMETMQSMSVSGSMEMSSLFDLSAADLEAPGTTGEGPAESADASTSGASGSSSSGSSDSTETETTTSVTETATATITITTTTTTTTAADGTVTTETTSTVSSKPKQVDLTGLLYRSLESSSASNAAKTFDIQA